MALFSAWSLPCGLLNYGLFILDILPEFSFINSPPPYPPGEWYILSPAYR